LKKNGNFAYVKKGDKMTILGNGIRVGTFILVIALAGIFCFSTWASEPKTNNNGDSDKAAQSAAGSESDNGPGVLEQEQAQLPAKIAKKRFPWLWVAAGAVVVGVVLYFTVIKKPEYKLNVSIGLGVSGYPIAGAFVYKKGKKVRYLYSLGYGYRALKVLLDNKAVAASGEFTMDRDHVLTITSEEQFYDLTVTLGAGVTGTPAAGIFTHREGTRITYNYLHAENYTDLQVKLDGVAVAASGSVLMDRGHTLEVAAVKWNEQYDERGTWLVVETKVNGEMKNFTITFKRDVNSKYYTGRVYSSDPEYNYSGYFAYIRTDSTSTVNLKWAIWESDWNRIYYEGVFTTPGSLSGNRLHYGYNSEIPDLESIWTATKIDD
jgi:hypothetical protein